jgi:hypothetical protein
MGFDFNSDSVTASADFDRPTGVIQAVLSNVVDLGEVDDKFNPGKKKHQGILVFQLSETYEKDGKQIPIQQCQFFTASLNQKSKLRSFVEGIIGVGLDVVIAKCKAEGKEFNLSLEKLVGRQCMLTIKKKVDSEYTVIESIAPKMKNLPDLVLQKDLKIPDWITDMIHDAKNATVGADVVTDVDIGSMISSIV